MAVSAAVVRTDAWRGARIVLTALVVLTAAVQESAAREAAPITFASPAPAREPTLAGGGEGSYGYGAQAGAAPARVIDVRAGAQRAPREAFPAGDDEAPVQVARAETQTGAAAPWLERERVGPPYEANGRWYVPTPEPGYSETGQASWYGPDFHGKATASGEVFDETALTAAHPTLPIPSLVQVTNLDNGREAILRVNDRGPFVGERLIDVSRAAAGVLGFEAAGSARVNVRYLGPAPRHVVEPALAQPSAVAAAPAARPAAVAAATQQSGPISLLPQNQPAQRQASYAPAQDAPARARYQPAAYTPPAPSYGGYVVQVGAFSDAANAERVRADAASAGPASIDVRSTARGALHRVRVGPWSSRAEAESARAQLASLGYPEAIVASR